MPQVSTIPSLRGQKYRQFQLFREPSVAVSKEYPFDFFKSSASGPLYELRIRMAGKITATGAGTSALLLKAPLSLLLNITFQGSHRKLKQRVIYNGPAIDLFFFTQLLENSEPELQAPSPGASATGAFLANFTIPLTLRRWNMPVYLDPRDYTNLSMVIKTGALPDYGAGVSTLDNWTITIDGTEEIDAPSLPHYEPSFVQLQLKADSTGTKLRPGGLSNDMVVLVMLRTNDDSAAGNSKLVDGLIQNLVMRHGSRELYNGGWTALQAKTRAEYGGGLPAATAQQAGIAMYDADFDADGSGAIDTREAPIDFEFDTSSTVDYDITDIVPAASDVVVATAMGLTPTL